MEEIIGVISEIVHFLDDHEGLSRNYICKRVHDDANNNEIYKIILHKDLPEDQPATENDLVVIIDLAYSDINQIKSHAWLRDETLVKQLDLEYLLCQIKMQIIFAHVLNIED